MNQVCFLQGSRFEPTYEELKLCSFIELLLCLECFEPTYEELKQKPIQALGMAVGRFEPTYEELKRGDKERA